MIQNLIFYSGIILSFFNPSIKLSSGKTATLYGNGRPILFSTGLFGTMPKFVYNKFLNNLKKDFTIVVIDGYSPIIKDDIYDVAKSLSVDSIAYMSHSSFNPEVLECNKINKAILLDPICIPELSINGADQRYISVNYPVLIIKANKLYYTEVPLPEWQDPIIDGNVTEIMYKNVGHPDILDDLWADLAKKYGFWDACDGETSEFKKWRFSNANSINKIRNKYRLFVSKKSRDFIMY